MTQPMPTESKRPAQGFDGDLRRRVGECVLITLALEAATTVGSQLPPWRHPLRNGLSPQMLLTLLTYSYAAGVHASEDIVWACQRDLATRYISSAAPLEEDTLRAFRRANRPWIEACLARVLERVSQETRAGAVTTECFTSPLESQSDTPFLTAARRRLELALLMDMAMAD